jgi:hypothetical protein
MSAASAAEKLNGRMFMVIISSRDVTVEAARA